MTKKTISNLEDRDYLNNPGTEGSGNPNQGGSETRDSIRTQPFSLNDSDDKEAEALNISLLLEEIKRLRVESKSGLFMDLLFREEF